jgi:dTDP-glucose 4,6-dehydratase
MSNVLITGVAGFIGSHVAEYFLRNSDHRVFGIDSMSYAAEDGRRLREIGAFQHNRFTMWKADVSKEDLMDVDPTWIVHLAAASHVDRSIQDPETFIQSNVVGTFKMLEHARRARSLKKFVYFSTDEVFGPYPSYPAGESIGFSEWSRYNTSSPYSATKAAGEELALAWENTYGVPVTICHCCNVFGKRQNSEKFIPKLVAKILAGEQVRIHTDKDFVSGSRMYVYAGDVALAISVLLSRGQTRQKYNIPGKMVSNMDMAVRVAKILRKPAKLTFGYPETERPGWDFSYAVSGAAIHAIGWEPMADFDLALEETVLSYVPVQP